MSKITGVSSTPASMQAATATADLLKQLFSTPIHKLTLPQLHELQKNIDALNVGKSTKEITKGIEVLKTFAQNPDKTAAQYEVARAYYTLRTSPSKSAKKIAQYIHDQAIEHFKFFDRDKDSKKQTRIKRGGYEITFLKENTQTVEIGKGVYGKVVKGEMAKLPPLALKKMHLDDKHAKHKGFRPLSYEKLVKEQALFKKIDKHDNIAPYYKTVIYFGKNQLKALSLNSLAKNDFEHFLQNSAKLTEQEVFNYFFQALKAIEHLHSKKIVHGDLKPDNFLLDEKGKLWLTDFGISSPVDDTYQLYGETSPHRSPESLKAKRTDTGLKLADATKMDIFGLGVFLYLLTNKGEWDKGVYKLYTHEVLFPKTQPIPGTLQDLIYHAVHKNPDKRFTLQQIQEHPWFKKMQAAAGKP